VDGLVGDGVEVENDAHLISVQRAGEILPVKAVEQGLEGAGKASNFGRYYELGHMKDGLFSVPGDYRWAIASQCFGRLGWVEAAVVHALDHDFGRRPE
jgi:hypothetical protein